MKIETLQFHPRKPAISDDIAQKLAVAEEAIYRLFVQGRPAYFGYSGALLRKSGSTSVAPAGLVA
jgi:hypothetical protein